MYIIEYNVNRIVVSKHEDGELPDLAVNHRRCTIFSELDLDGQPGDLLLRTINALQPHLDVKVTVLPPEPSRFVWDLLEATTFPVEPFEETAAVPPVNVEPKKSTKSKKKGLQAVSDSSMSPPPEDGPPIPMEDDMTNQTTTTEKKASKSAGQGKGKTTKSAGKGKGKTTKSAGKDKTTEKKVAKSANGLPREGTKTAKLLALISRPEGATFAEMQKATGWKEMRGTALVLARRVGKKLHAISDPDGKKATRWAAK